jgi:hypothetical protein
MGVEGGGTMTIGTKKVAACGRALALALCVAAAVPACKRHGARPPTVHLQPATAVPYPGAPTIAALDLEFDGTTLVIRKVSAKRDTVQLFKLPDHLAAIRDGDEALFEWRAIARDGSVVSLGQFTVALRGQAAYQVPGSDHVAHQRTALVRTATTVGVPLKNDAIRLEIDRLTPAPGPGNAWTHTPAGRADLPVPAAPQPSDGGGLR